MKTILPCLVLGLALATSPAFAQADVLSGTWQGLWTPESGYDAVTVRFVLCPAWRYSDRSIATDPAWVWYGASHRPTLM